MKGYCFLILAVALLMYFQKEPVYTVIIIGIGVGIYLFIKARKNKNGVFGFFGINESPQQDRINDLVTLILLQQLFSDSPTSKQKPANTDTIEPKKESYENEIMELFDKYEIPNRTKINLPNKKD